MREFQSDTRKPNKPHKHKPDFLLSTHENAQYNSSTADFSPHVVKFINDLLFEEEMEDNLSMLQDSLALQAAERSFYQVLIGHDPSPNSSPDHLVNKITHQNPSDDFNLLPSGRKHHQAGEDGELEGRSYKKSAVTSEMLTEDSVIYENGDRIICCPLFDPAKRKEYKKLIEQDGVSTGRSIRLERMLNRQGIVDLWGLLNQCAQAVANMDQRAAKEILNQIRQHSSPFGNGTERLAHYFANGLEARLAGASSPFSSQILRSRKASAADIIKAYKAYTSVCPFRRISNRFANRSIAKIAENSTKIHIIDFGISYGFQWPCFISRLATRPGGPPRIRMTGIELPQPGFRPAERVEQTGQRLKKHAEKFNVPFEYTAIAQRWETIMAEDIIIDRDEITIVNCMYRLRNILDDTLEGDSPRDSVLKLIKNINPDLFVHGIVNGGFNAAYFGMRFKEALFHFSALFDMMEANLPRKDEDRLVFEREMFGKDAMNVIGCEGEERYERPETYKQWQTRNQRAGLRMVPLDKKIIKPISNLVKEDYHEDFYVDEDGFWLLMGWKGRVIHALSCWKPTIH